MVHTRRHMDTVVAYHAALQRRIRDSLNAVSFGPGRRPCNFAIGLVFLGLAFLMVGILVITIRFRHVYLPDWNTQFLGPFFVILFLMCCSGAVYLVIYAKRKSNEYRREIVFRPMGDDGVVVIHKSTIPHEEKMKDQLKSGTTPHQVVRPQYEQGKKGFDNNGYEKNGGDRPDGRYDKRRDDRRHPRDQSDSDRYRDRRGPPDDRPRRPPGDRPRGPPDDRPRGPPGDRPRGPPGDRPRGPPGDRPRGPPGDRPRGPPGDRPRGPPRDRPRGPDDRPRGPDDRPRGPPGDRYRDDRRGPDDRPRGPPGDRYRDDPRPGRDRAAEDRHRQRMEDDMKPPAYNDIDKERQQRPDDSERRERRERTPDMERQRVRTPDFERRGPDAYGDTERRGQDRYRERTPDLDRRGPDAYRERGPDMYARRAPTININKELESESEL